MPYQPRQLLAYGTVFVFLVFILFYGVADSIKPYSSFKSKDIAGMQADTGHGVYEGAKWSNFPDLTRYEPLDALTSREFPMNEPGKRVIVVGDIHGMMKPLNKLLKRLKYQPSNDVLIHVGDIIAKGTHKGSLEVLDFMTSNKIIGVRGNHDQLVIEWRGWLDWISTLPGGNKWLERLERRWQDIQNNEQNVEQDIWIEGQAKAHPDERRLFRSVPKGWVLFSDHHKIAKDMTSKNFRYLLELPLRLYIPSAHVFIVHAGLLPSNPEYSSDDKINQPLARLPVIPGPPGRHNGSYSEDLADSMSSIESNGHSNEIEKLRYLQEIGLLTQIPQNVDPWAVLNMRSILDGKVSRNAKEGKPWAKFWKEHMESCVGYRKNIQNRSDADEDEDVADIDEHRLTTNSTLAKRKGRLSLLCYPSTTIYGHTASRGLDIKRWSFGLDSGCVYGRKLSALVLEGPGSDRRSIGHDSSVSDEEDDELETLSAKPFGDSATAKIVRVKC